MEENRGREIAGGNGGKLGKDPVSTILRIMFLSLNEVGNH